MQNIDNNNLDIDDWRGDVAAAIRDAGHGWLADEVGGLGDDDMRELHASHNGNPAVAGATIVAREF